MIGRPPRLSVAKALAGSGDAVLPVRDAVLRSGHYSPDWSGTERGSYLRLDRNECTKPLSTVTASALCQHIMQSGVQTYPELGRLSMAIAKYCGLPADQILATNGSDQGIDITLRTFVGEGDTMLVARPEFPMFEQVASVAGVKILGVPYDDDLEFPYAKFDEAIQGAAPDLIVFINPNNPTGTSVDINYIAKVVSENPGTPIIVDEAYFEFTGQTVAGMTSTHENLLVLRSFSKAFAMAGLRLGYIIGNPTTIEEIRKLRGPFDVNSLAIVAAEAQLKAVDEVRGYAKEIMTRVKPMVLESFNRSGVKTWPGRANFLLVQPKRCPEAVEVLRHAGILVRPMHSPRLKGMFRMSLGTFQEMERVMEVFEHYMRGAD